MLLYGITTTPTEERSILVTESRRRPNKGVNTLNHQGVYDRNEKVETVVDFVFKSKIFYVSERIVLVTTEGFFTVKKVYD